MPLMRDLRIVYVLTERQSKDVFTVEPTHIFYNMIFHNMVHIFITQKDKKKN